MVIVRIVRFFRPCWRGSAFPAHGFGADQTVALSLQEQYMIVDVCTPQAFPLNRTTWPGYPHFWGWCAWLERALLPRRMERGWIQVFDGRNEQLVVVMKLRSSLIYRSVHVQKPFNATSEMEHLVGTRPHSLTGPVVLAFCARLPETIEERVCVHFVRLQHLYRKGFRLVQRRKKRVDRPGNIREKPTPQHSSPEYAARKSRRVRLSTNSFAASLFETRLKSIQ